MSSLVPPSISQMDTVVQFATAYLEQSDDMDAETHAAAKADVDRVTQWVAAQPNVFCETPGLNADAEQPTIADLRMMISLLNTWMPSSKVPAKASITAMKVQTWVAWLEKATAQDEIGMAADLLEYHGFKNPLGVKSEHVEPAFVISTAHIDEATAQALGGGQTFGLVVYPKAGDGWWIYLDELSGEPTTEPECLTECIQAALDADCVWLCIDMDAALHETLPTYSW